MADTSFDIIVVGGGPGGYVAAIRAAQLSMKTAVVEREHMGGICLNWGCIPTKALLRTSEVYSLIKHADSFGLSVKDVAYDARKVVERSRKIANQLSNGVKGLMRKNKITVFDGTAKLAGSEGSQRKLAVAMNDKSNVTLTAKNVILATGARARQLPGLESDGKLVWTYKEAMVPPEFPKSLLVIGSGAIGIEFASFYRTMGAEVTVAEVLERILPVEDEEVSAFAKRQFEKQGMKILTSATVGRPREGQRQGDGHHHLGRQAPGDHGRSCDQRRRHRRQYRKHRARGHEGEGREEPYRDRPMGLYRRTRRLCNRRCRRPALARSQGHA